MQVDDQIYYPLPKVCYWCGGAIEDRRSDTKFCCNAHKQKMYRWHKTLAKQRAIGLDVVYTLGEYRESLISREDAEDALKAIIEQAKSALKRRF